MFEVGLPDNVGSQESIRKTTSTIVRYSNAEATTDYANGSVSSLDTVPMAVDNSLTPPTTTDHSAKITGEIFFS